MNAPRDELVPPPPRGGSLFAAASAGGGTAGGGCGGGVEDDDGFGTMLLAALSTSPPPPAPPAPPPPRPASSSNRDARGDVTWASTRKKRSCDRDTLADGDRTMCAAIRRRNAASCAVEVAPRRSTQSRTLACAAPRTASGENMSSTDWAMRLEPHGATQGERRACGAATIASDARSREALERLVSRSARTLCSSDGVIARRIAVESREGEARGRTRALGVPGTRLSLLCSTGPLRFERTTRAPFDRQPSGLAGRAQRGGG